MQFSGSLAQAGPTAALHAAWCGDSWVVPGVFSNHASEHRVHIIHQLIIAGPTVSN